MPDHAAFIATICDRPTEDGPRLVYADWLEEQGDADRAEFIRVQVKLATIPPLIIGSETTALGAVTAPTTATVRTHSIEPDYRGRIVDVQQDSGNGRIVHNTMFLRGIVENQRQEMRPSDRITTELTIQVSEMRIDSMFEDQVKAVGLRERERALLEAHGRSWVTELVHACKDGDGQFMQWGYNHVKYHSTRTIEWTWCRGFIDSITLSWPDWLAHAAAIRAAQPVSACRLTTWPEIAFSRVTYGRRFDAQNRLHIITAEFTATCTGSQPMQFLQQITVDDRELSLNRDTEAWARRQLGEKIEQDRTQEGYLKARYPGIAFTLPPAEPEAVYEVYVNDQQFRGTSPEQVMRLADEYRRILPPGAFRSRSAVRRIFPPIPALDVTSHLDGGFQRTYAPPEEYNYRLQVAQILDAPDEQIARAVDYAIAETNRRAGYYATTQGANTVMMRRDTINIAVEFIRRRNNFSYR